jgi:hypothetical protein
LEQARVYRQNAKESQTVSMKEELRRRKRVLRRLGYTTAEGVLTVKVRSIFNSMVNLTPLHQTPNILGSLFV